MSNPKIVLAYSGGLDTSVAVHWLNKTYGYDVIAVSIDVGEGKDLDVIKQKALDVGAISSHMINAQDEFAEQYVLPALKANAMYEGEYPLVSALSRPLISKLLVDIAHKEGAVAIAHGCTGKGNDQVRFDVGITTLDPTMKIVAPVREHAMSRDEALAYADTYNIPLSITKASPYSIDQNLWGRSCECGALENPWVAPPEDAYELTSNVATTPDQPEIVDIEFVKGKPVSLNGTAYSLSNLIHTLNTIAGKHGIGRIDHIENRLVGIKSREVYEAPAGMTLIKAHKALEALTLSRDVAHFKPVLEQKLSHLIYEGLWFSPLREAIFAFIDKTQEHVTGTVKVSCFKGQATVIGRKSDVSLYDEALATYTDADAFDHNAAVGFINLWGLPQKVFSQVHAAKKDAQ